MVIFVVFGSLEDKPNTKISLTSMWQFVVWFIWKYRNDLTFSRKTVEHLTEKINFPQFNWYVSKCFDIPCTHYVWMMESFFFLLVLEKFCVVCILRVSLGQTLEGSLTSFAPFEFMCD